MRRVAGFTLLEILIASVLFAFLMSVYYVAFISVIETEEYARQQRHFASIGPATLDLIENDILSLYTHPRAPDAFPFRGDDDSMSGQPADRFDFVTRRASIHVEELGSADVHAHSPINEVGYRLSRGDSDLGDVRRLYRRESYYVDGTPLQGGDFFEIYDRVYSFDVVYAGYRVEEEARASAADRAESRLEKFESWDSEERKAFPTAIIITLTIEPPRLGVVYKDEESDRLTRQTLVRIVQPPQADDIVAAPPANNNANTPQIPNNPGSGNQGR